MNNSNELMDALRKADAAGNEDDARAIAAMIQREEPSQTPEPSSEEDSLEAYLQAQADAENANRTALGRGFSRSVDLTGEGVGSALEGLGSVLGLEGLEEYGAEMALENEAQLQRAEASATRRQDVEGLDTGLSYFGETLAESSVPMGAGIGAGIGALGASAYMFNDSQPSADPMTQPQSITSNIPMQQLQEISDLLGANGAL